jgi:membrane protein implicated in regulation of membrane protease activity
LIFVAWLFRTLMRLQSSGNLDIANAIGLTGRVYLRIPKAGQGTGKVTMLVQERSLEIDAFTDEEQEIKTGQAVKVIAQRGNQLLVRSIDHLDRT